MRMTRRELLGYSAGAGLAALYPTRAFGASTTGRPAGAAKGADAVLNFGVIQEPSTLDPHLSTSVSDVMLWNVYGRLADIDSKTGKVVPQLATEWDVSKDGLTVSFKLRKGVLFADGTPFDAQAAIVNFKRCTALKSYVPEIWDNIDSLDAPDALTLRVKLKQASNPWVAMLTQNPKMISPKAIQDHQVSGDLAQKWLASNTVGSGAYTNVAWEHGSNLRWEANPRYWKGWSGSHVTTVNNRVILDPGTQRLQVEKGDLDVAMNYTQDALPALRANRSLRVEGVDQPNILYIRLNNFTGPTADPRVRKAISHAFDYKSYTILLGYDRARGDMPVPSQLFGSQYRPAKISYFTYDIAEAKRLLKEAGHADGFEMNLFHEAGVPQKDLLGEFFQASLAKAGIKVKIMVEPFANILARGADQDSQKKWDTAIHSWILYTSPLWPDPSSFLTRMYLPYPKAVRNLLGYNNPKVTTLVTEGLRQVDNRKAMDLYWQANLIIVDDYPDLILDRSIQYAILRTWVNGYAPDVIVPWRWTYWDIWKTA